MTLKLQYKNIVIETDGSTGYYLGYQMLRCYKKITKEQYANSLLPILKVA